MQEIRASERVYVQSLDTVVQHYLEPMLSLASDVATRGAIDIDADSVVQLFSNVSVCAARPSNGDKRVRVMSDASPAKRAFPERLREGTVRASMMNIHTSPVAIENGGMVPSTGFEPLFVRLVPFLCSLLPDVFPVRE